MPAFSFQPQFVDPILERRKRQTIRARRRDGREPARPGAMLSLYCHQRLPYGFLIAQATCTEVHPIRIQFENADRLSRHLNSVYIEGRNELIVQSNDVHNRLDAFAQKDGFDSWAELRSFWEQHHPGVTDFSGWIIYWEELAWTMDRRDHATHPEQTTRRSSPRSP